MRPGLREDIAALEALLSALPPRDAEATGEVREALVRATALAEAIAARLSPGGEAEILARAIARCVAGAARGEVVAAYAIAFGASAAATLSAIVVELDRGDELSAASRRAAEAAAYELDTLQGPGSQRVIAPDVPVSRLVDKRR